MIIFQVHHYIKPDMVDAYVEATLKNARGAEQEPGILRFDFMRDKEDPTHFMLFEIYADEAARESHFETEHFLSWKEVYLAASAGGGRGENWEAVYPEGFVKG